MKREIRTHEEGGISINKNKNVKTNNKIKHRNGLLCKR